MPKEKDQRETASATRSQRPTAAAAGSCSPSICGRPGWEGARDFCFGMLAGVIVKRGVGRCWLSIRRSVNGVQRSSCSARRLLVMVLVGGPDDGLGSQRSGGQAGWEGEYTNKLNTRSLFS